MQRNHEGHRGVSTVPSPISISRKAVSEPESDMRTSPLRVKIMVFSVRSIMQPTTSPDCQGRPNGSLPRCQRWPYREAQRCGVVRGKQRKGETQKQEGGCLKTQCKMSRSGQGGQKRSHLQSAPQATGTALGPPSPLASVSHPFHLGSLLLPWLE